MKEAIYEGHIDAVDAEGQVVGWVWNKRSPEPVSILIRIDGQEMEQIVADRPRRDLQRARRHEGNHGFVFVIPEEMRGSAIRLEVVVAANDQPLIGSPKIISFERHEEEQPRKKFRLFGRR